MSSLAERLLKAAIIITIMVFIAAIFGFKLNDTKEKYERTSEFNLAEHGYQFVNNVIVS